MELSKQNVENNLNVNFSKWFGNSKVVYNGKPLPVYHGSSEEFDEFMGDTYFTPDYFNADGYAGDGTWNAGDNNIFS